MEKHPLVIELALSEHQWPKIKTTMGVRLEKGI